MWDDTKFLEDKLTNLDEASAAYSLREAYKRIIGEYPSNESLAILIGQTALETGRWKSMHNGNWGNIKSRPTDGHYWTMYVCDEIINGRRIVFKPPHDQCKFRAYLTPTDGAEDYIKFLTGDRYAKALIQLQNGEAEAYTIALKNAGYFTGSLNSYVTAMKSLFKEFVKKLDNGLLSEHKEVILPPPLEVLPLEVEGNTVTADTLPKTPDIPPPAPVPDLSELEPKNNKTNIVKSIGMVGIFTAIYLAISYLFQNC